VLGEDLGYERGKYGFDIKEIYSASLRIPYLAKKHGKVMDSSPWSCKGGHMMY
jgi:hypothetical protein